MLNGRPVSARRIYPKNGEARCPWCDILIGTAEPTSLAVRRDINGIPVNYLFLPTTMLCGGCKKPIKWRPYDPPSVAGEPAPRMLADE